MIRIEFGGVCIKCEGGHILDGKELEVGLDIANSSRAKEGQKKIVLDYYSVGSVQKMWSAKTTNLWINVLVRDGGVELERNILLKDMISPSK